MQYVDTNRNLFSFLSREKIKILQIAKEKLSEEAKASDSQKINEIQNSLDYVGLTRAKDACYIMNGTARFRSKKNDYIFAEPSLFLSKPGLAERRKDVRWEM